MHNMHNLLVGFENFPFCAARRSRLFCDALTYALTEEEACEIIDSSDAAFRLYLKGLMLAGTFTTFLRAQGAGFVG